MSPFTFFYAESKPLNEVFFNLQKTEKDQPLKTTLRHQVLHCLQLEIIHAL